MAKRGKSGESKPAARQFLAAPDDQVFDPRAGMKVSRFGQDRGAVERDTRQELVGVDDGVQSVSRVRDGLDQMRRKGDINDNQLTAARLFQDEFERSGMDHYASVNLMATSGGGMGIEDVMTRAIRSRDYVAHIFSLLGGNGTAMARVVFWVIGCRKNLEVVARKEGRNAQYWCGVLHAALEIMGEDYERMLQGKPRRPR